MNDLIKRAVPRFRSKYTVDRESGCWNWKAYKNPQGYGYFRYENHTMAHRFSWLLHFGEIPEGMCICHTCDNPSCVNPDHLWVGTIADNNHDCENKGRRPERTREFYQQMNLKSRRKRRRFSEDQIRKIRASCGVPSLLATQYQTSPQMICAIRSRKTYADIN